MVAPAPNCSPPRDLGRAEQFCARALADSRPRLEGVACYCPSSGTFAEKDPLRNQKVIDALADRVRDSGATFEQHDYSASGHLFADPDMPVYDAAAADLMFERVVEFLNC